MSPELSGVISGVLGAVFGGGGIAAFLSGKATRESIMVKTATDLATSVRNEMTAIRTTHYEDMATVRERVAVAEKGLKECEDDRIKLHEELKAVASRGGRRSTDHVIPPTKEI